MDDAKEQINKQIDERILKIIPQYLKSAAFTDRKLTDTPTDGLAVVNRNYINMYGSVVGAPVGSIVGQQYFATDLGYPIFKNQNTRWVSPTGSVVA